jgi:hypothetical protein
MKSMSVSEMEKVEGGELSTSCGVMVGATVASFFYFPFVTASLAEVTVAVCATT